MSGGAQRDSGSRVNRFKARLAAGETVIGAWLTIPELSVAEIMAGAGFDYVIIDAEHAPWTVSEIQVAHAGFRGSETVLLARVPWNDHVAIKQALDAGIDGLVCPMVRTVEEARSLIAACRYPPAGPAASVRAEPRTITSELGTMRRRRMTSSSSCPRSRMRDSCASSMASWRSTASMRSAWAPRISRARSAACWIGRIPRSLAR